MGQDLHSGRRPDIAARQAARATALVAQVAEAVARGQPADATLQFFFRAHRECGSRDRKFMGDLVFSFFRWKGWLPESPLETACALAWALDAGSPHPSATALSGGEPPPPSGRLTLEEKAILVARRLNLDAPPRPADLLPSWVPASLAGHADRFIEAIQRRPPAWVRVRQGHVPAVRAALEREKIPASPQAVVTCALALPGSSPLQRLAPDLRTRFEVQDLASQAVGLLAAPQAGENWWDACAGSGGKALHLADLMGNRGRIVASDIRADALARLRQRARRAGCAIIRMSPAAETGGPPFDGVLVDAPCSGLGTWSRNPDARWRTAAGDPERRAAVQADILGRAAQRVRPGGRLVYSVCTLTRRETLDSTDEFLRAHPEFRLEPGAHPLSGADTDGRFWIWPWDGPCDGMYAARFRRG
ncbi:MAG: RsmB/NOP family class I SAM-dependent RNA methyltransferase [Kiritimatiellae bacterium]|nr:RsmB/NOP family class I SAM-dependent RNA methyltransferase [Kiritimatiellia bacterium]